MEIDLVTEEKILEEYKKDPNLNKTQLAKELKVHRQTIKKVIDRNFKSKPSPISEIMAKDKSKLPGTLDDFRANFDDGYIIPKKIEDGVEKHLRVKGQPGYLEDSEFRQRCGVSVNKWRRFADQFKSLQVVKDGKIIWGHPEIIEQMREILYG